MEYTEYDDETLKHLQQTELMILKDFIKICEDNGLTYYIHTGSLIGAIRHNGFIPWDDDLDVVMFREDYEKFKKIFLSSDNKKYKLLTSETEKDYCYVFSKLMLKGTIFEENWVEYMDFDLGINIDIFVLDDLSNNRFKRFYQIKKIFFYNKLLIMSKIKIDNLPFVTKVVTHSFYHILNFLKIRPYKINNNLLRFLKKYESPDAEYILDIAAPMGQYPQIFSKKDFKPVKKVKFEDIEVNVPAIYDEVLKSYYGDYMKLPPEEERYNHITRKIDFGPYK